MRDAVGFQRGHVRFVCGGTDKRLEPRPAIRDAAGDGLASLYAENFSLDVPPQVELVDSIAQ
jgi:hypothetical protein